MPDRAPREQRFGLCATCRHGQVVPSSRGAEFLLCHKSSEADAPRDAAQQYPKYPHVPIAACPGYERR